MTPDYIIVGAGSAGCVLANRLTKDGRFNVVLLESGGEATNPWMRVPLGMVRLVANPKVAWLDMTVPTPRFGDRSILLAQGRTVGGSSSINGMLYVRGQKEDFDGWSDAGCSGWSWKEVLPYFKRSERLASGGSDEHHGRSGELRLSWITDIAEVSKCFLAAAQDAGLPFNEDINSGVQDGVGYLLGTIHNGRRQSAAQAFLRPARRRPNLTVQTGNHVRRVVFDGKRAVGIEVETPGGEIRTLRCKREVILSAGTIGTPHILQHSGVGEPDHLASLGIAPVVSSPEVGRNLQDHLFGHLKFRLGKSSMSLNEKFNSAPRMGIELAKWLVAGKGAMTSTSSHICAFIKSDENVARSDIQIAMRPFSFGMKANGVIGIDDFPGMTVSAIQTRPFSRGAVRIESADPRVRAKIHIDYLSDERDVATLSKGMAHIREIMTQPEIARHVVEEVEPGADQSSRAALEHHLRTTASTVYHPVGTCRMGADAGAVLDPELRVRGAEGLRVIDASIMPVITSGNTNAPAIMIGEKGADMVRRAATNAD
ncbi:MAG: choline dehydrogenase [Alphaproteobacteria bacterium HGW-Alphaproteobacteria-5]|nr:MAG: choline dehydrogenase [Alphaproteobacteria bacterium HGW-Alphaproteobacteria-5]